MKKPALILALAALAIPLMGASTPAQASVRWHAGAGFRVGGLDFSIGFNAPSYFAPGYRPVFFYRTRAPLHFDGYACTSACYIRDSYRYHDRACPLVRRHFAAYRFDPFNAWRYVDYGRFGYDRRPYDYRWRDHDRYRYDRHRYDRHRHDHRYDSRRGDYRYEVDRHRRFDDRAYRRYRDDADSDSDSGRRRHRGRGRD